MSGVDWIAGLQTTAAGFDMIQNHVDLLSGKMHVSIQNHVDLLSGKVHAVPTRSTASRRRRRTQR